MIKRGRIWRPDYQLVHPHRPGLLGCPDPAAPAGTNRYDNSAALLWYKMDEAAAPFVNSGSGGVRDLTYYGAPCDGEMTFGGASIFDTDTAPVFDGALSHTTYVNATDDAAWFAGSATAWVWFEFATGARYGYLWGRVTNGADYGPWSVQLLGTNAFAVGLKVTAGTLSYQSWNNAYTRDAPHLLAWTWDNATLRLYIDGVENRNFARVDSFVTAANDKWLLGDSRYGGAANVHAVCSVYELGFDDSVYDAATLLDMYNTAGV